jgi:predicted RNA binding protein YcfA (HicA-like mRNA interferase family)
MKVRDLVKQLEAEGWYLARTRGSHHQFKHPSRPGTVTVAGKSGVDVPPGTLNAILILVVRNKYYCHRN